MGKRVDNVDFLRTPHYPRGNRPASVSASALRDIKDYIHQNNLSPGETMPTESELCDMLGYSRSSIREAIRVLSALDIVTVRHGHGMYVSNMSLEPLVNGLVFRIINSAQESLDFLGHVVDTREALEVSLGTQLVGKMDPQSIRELQELVDEMRARIKVGQEFLEEDQEFHRRLIKDTSNPLIRELSDALWQVHSEVMPMLNLDKLAPSDRESSADKHQLIVDTVGGDDLEAYQQAVREHYAPLRAVIDNARSARAR